LKVGRRNYMYIQVHKDVFRLVLDVILAEKKKSTCSGSSGFHPYHGSQVSCFWSNLKHVVRKCSCKEGGVGEMSAEIFILAAATRANYITSRSTTDYPFRRYRILNMNSGRSSRTSCSCISYFFARS
jgi:hypothetical protein